MQIGLRSGQLDMAVDGSQRLAAAAEQSRYGLRAGFFYPLVVCGLAYLGLIGFCLWFEPTLEGMHEEFRLAWGSGGSRAACAARDDALLGSSTAVELLAWLGWRQFGKAASMTTSDSSGDFLSRLTGACRAVAKQRWANFADSLATLVAADTPLDEALRMAGVRSGDAGISSQPPAVADSLENASIGGRQRGGPGDFAVLAVGVARFEPRSTEHGRCGWRRTSIATPPVAAPSAPGCWRHPGVHLHRRRRRVAVWPGVVRSCCAVAQGHCGAHSHRVAVIRSVVNHRSCPRFVTRP